MPKETVAQLVMTIGHSTHSLEDFVRMLVANGVSCVVDVRSIPRSFHNAQFNKDSLPQVLRDHGLGYLHMPALGGLRHARDDSPNTGWRNASFRGFADYMQTPAFTKGLEELIRLSDQCRVVLMCAEAVPWRCHRSLIADALLIRGVRTEDIISATQRRVHTLTPFARVRGVSITYPAENIRSTPKTPIRHALDRTSRTKESAFPTP